MKGNFEFSRHVSSFGCLLLYFLSRALVGVQDSVYLRVIQVGYIQKDEKVVVAFAKTPVRGISLFILQKQKILLSKQLRGIQRSLRGGPMVATDTIIGTIGATSMMAFGESFPLKKGEG